MKPNLKVQFALSILIIFTLACNLSAPATEPAATPEVVTIVVTATQEAAAEVVTEEAATEAATKATAVLNQDLNVRSGPGTDYSIVTALPGGTTVDIIGKNADGSWWFIAFEGGKTGWVSAPFTTSSNTESVPVVEAQPSGQQGNSGNSGSGNSGGSNDNSGGGGNNSNGNNNGNDNSNDNNNNNGNDNNNDNSGGGQIASPDNDYKVDVNIKGDGKNLSSAVSYPDGDTQDTIFVSVGGFDSVTTSGNVTYTLTCSGGNPKVTSVGGALKNGSPGCNKTWTVFYTNDSDKETIKIKLESGGYVDWTLVISAGG